MDTTIQVRKLTCPTPDQLDRAAEVVAAAWHGDRFAEALMGGNYDFMIPWRRAAIAAAAIGGELHVASYGDIEIAGVATWYGPGRALFDSSDQQAAGFDTLMQKFPPELREWWQEYLLPRYSAHIIAALGEGTKLAAWHLQSLATHPDFQGKGIGRALVEFVESRVLPEGHSIVLEAHTEGNVAMYRKWGYSATEPEQYESAMGRLNLYAMIKKPNQTS